MKGEVPWDRQGVPTSDTALAPGTARRCPGHGLRQVVKAWQRQTVASVDHNLVADRAETASRPTAGILVAKAHVGRPFMPVPKPPCFPRSAAPFGYNQCQDTSLRQYTVSVIQKPGGPGGGTCGRAELSHCRTVCCLAAYRDAIEILACTHRHFHQHGHLRTLAKADCHRSSNSGRFPTDCQTQGDCHRSHATGQ